MIPSTFLALSIALTAGPASAPPETEAAPDFYGEINVINTYLDPGERETHIEPPAGFDRYLEFKERFRERTRFNYMMEDGLITQAGHGHLHANNELNLIGVWDAVDRARTRGSLFFWWQHAATIGGLNTSDFMAELGLLSPLNGGDTAPDGTAHRLQLLAWEQSLAGDSLRLMAGKITTRITFDMNRYAVSDREDFYTPMIVNNPVVSFTARGGIGLFAEWARNLWYVRGMLRDADADDDYLDLDSVGNGHWEYLLEAAFTPEVGSFGPGSYRVTYARTGETTTGPTAGPSRWSLSSSFDQDLGESVGAFLRYAYAEHPIRTFRQRIAGGVQLLGPLGYDDDRVGIGGWWGEPADQTRGGEYGLEVFWRLQIGRLVELTPDLQVVFDPALDPGRSHAIVGGLRLRVVI